jgi:hypothetical protein
VHRQVVVSGIAGDPSNPLVWGYVDCGPRVARTQRERHAVAVTDIRDCQTVPADAVNPASAI